MQDGRVRYNCFAHFTHCFLMPAHSLAIYSGCPAHTSGPINVFVQRGSSMSNADEHYQTLHFSRDGCCPFLAKTAIGPMMYIQLF
jgi:hypothetical protein